MRNWKIILEFNGKKMEITIKAPYYSDAFKEAEKQYPGCIVISIEEIKE